MVTMRVEHIGLGWDFNKIGGLFCKASRATAERHAKQEQVLINLILRHKMNENRE